MTVAHTARKQGEDMLPFCAACVEAHTASTPVPSLLDERVAADDSSSPSISPAKGP